jgi:hypothetical protein
MGVLARDFRMRKFGAGVGGVAKVLRGFEKLYF